ATPPSATGKAAAPQPTRERSAAHPQPETDARAAPGGTAAVRSSASSAAFAGTHSVAGDAAPALAPPAAVSPVRATASGIATPHADAGPAATTELTSAAGEWLDAYFHHDATRMASVAGRDMEIFDQRTATEKPSPTAANVQRSLEQVKFRFASNGAIMTA